MCVARKVRALENFLFEVRDSIRTDDEIKSYAEFVVRRVVFFVVVFVTRLGLSVYSNNELRRRPGGPTFIFILVIVKVVVQD